MPGRPGRGQVQPSPWANSPTGPKSTVSQDGYNPYVDVSYHLGDITKDAAGTVLPGATVRLFRTDDNVLQQVVVSDANGAYSFNVPPGVSFFVVAYKAGGTDVAGTSVNTLTGAV